MLADSSAGGVHLAVSPDLFRVNYFQGHPEYDFNSLFKEFKREALRYARGERPEPPPFPDNYFEPIIQPRVRQYMADIVNSPDNVALLRDHETAIERHLDNTWGDTAKAIINNWLGLVYKVTNLDRQRQFMPGTDPNDPLGLRDK